MKHLTSRQNPWVAAYRAVADGRDRSRLLVDGTHLLEEALDAGVSLTHVVVAADAMGTPDVEAIVSRVARTAAELCSASSAVMSVLSPVRSASPIVALATRPSTSETVLIADRPALVVCAVDLQDPGNVGAIIRVAEAGGAAGVAIAGQSADPFGWKALRGAMGSAFRLPLQHPCDPDRLVADVRRQGGHVYATAPRGGMAPERADLTGLTLLLIGGEGPGLPSTLVATADACLSVPMTAPVESLNAAVCTALLVYEARRQRAAVR
ncbi:MAG: TrmH family RNA methyltransferase, partial [Vicinamibacterales bacterium]